MTFRGTVKNGVVVFAEAMPLREGTPVRVEPVRARKKPKPTNRKRPLRPMGRWAGGPEEIGRLLGQIQRLRNADLPLEREAWR